MESVLDRIVALVTAQDLTEAELCRRAGLSPSAISVLRTRTKRSQDASMHSAQLVAVASVLGVAPEYLATGEHRASGPSDYPQRDRAVEAARLLGFPAGAIARVQAETPDKDHDVLIWFRRIELAAAELQATG